MSIRVQCEGCQKRYMVSDRSSGRRIECKDCGQTISIPDEPEPKRSSPAKQKRKRLACPACVKSSLTERIVKDGLCVDVCRSCHGTWLDGGEFLQLAANTDEAKQELLSLSWEASKKKRRCPRCHSHMSESGFVNYETQIDFCEECDGLWFDAGELKEALQIIKASAPTTKRKRRQKSSSKETVETLMTESLADESVYLRPIRIETSRNALRIIRKGGWFSSDTVVEITKKQLSFRHGLLRLQKNIPIEDLAQIFVVEIIHRGGHSGGVTTPTTYSSRLYALKKNGKRLRIMAGLSRGIAPEIEERIEVFLNISDEEVSTSLYQKLNDEFAAHESRSWRWSVLHLLVILALIPVALVIFLSLLFK